MLNVTAKDIASKKKIGLLNGHGVVEVVLKGGLHLIVTKQGDAKTSILGTGPHRAVARFIAEKNEPDLQWTEMSKSDHLDVHALASVLPYWTNMTNLFRSNNKG